MVLYPLDHMVAGLEGLTTETIQSLLPLYLLYSFKPPTSTGLLHLKLILDGINYRNSRQGFGVFVYNANPPGNQTGNKI